MKPEYDKLAGSGDKEENRCDILWDELCHAITKLKEIGTPPFNFIIPDDETIKKINKQNEKWLQDFINSRSNT